MDEIIITRDKLIAAHERWDRDAKAGQWTDRTDDKRYEDSADYLLELMKV